MIKRDSSIEQVRKSKSRFIYSLLPVLVSTLGVLCWVLASNDFQDDHYFRYIVPKPYDNHALNFAEFEKFDSPVLLTIDDAIESIINHYSIFNARLADKLLILSALLPSWLVDMMHAFSYATMIIIFLSLVKSDWWRYPVLTTFVILLIWLILPWDRLYSSNAYFFNYLWSSTINLAFIFALSKTQQSCRNVCLLSALALMAAMMHEGFAVPIAVGFFVLMIRRCFERKQIRLSVKENFRLIIVISCYFIGVLLYAVCPGLWWRLENPWDSAAFSDYLYAFTIGAIPMWLVVFLMLIIRKQSGKECLKKLLVDNMFYVVVIIASMLLSLLTSTFDRAWWLAYLFAILLIFRQLLQIEVAAKFLSGFSCYKKISVVLITILMTMFYAKICHAQSVMTAEAEKCRVMLNTSKSNFICIDTHSRNNMPRYMLNIPLGVKEDYPFKEYYRIKGAGLPIIYPEDYADLSFEEFPKVEGDNPLRGIYPWYYSPFRLNRENRVFNVTFGDPDKGESDGNINLFFSLRRWIAKLSGETGRLQRVYELHEIPVPISNEMRQNGVSVADTAWFYMFEKNEKSLKGCQVIKMDRFENEDSNSEL